MKIKLRMKQNPDTQFDHKKPEKNTEPFCLIVEIEAGGEKEKEVFWGGSPQGCYKSFVDHLTQESKDYVADLAVEADLDLPEHMMVRLGLERKG